MKFVLLEHRWRGVHWDFMLETAPGGPLRTWAVDAEVVAGLDLPARALSDHRAAYLDYEGPVTGGRGEVRRVDGGTFDRLEWNDDRVRVRLRGDQLRGMAELRRAVAAAGGEPAGWALRLGNLD